MQADLEALDAADAAESAGKGKAKRSDKALDLERLIGGHGAHIARLEQVLRLLENDQVGHLFLVHTSRMHVRSPCRKGCTTRAAVTPTGYPYGRPSTRFSTSNKCSEALACTQLNCEC